MYMYMYVYIYIYICVSSTLRRRALTCCSGMVFENCVPASPPNHTSTPS